MARGTIPVEAGLLSRGYVYQIPLMAARYNVRCEVKNMGGWLVRRYVIELEGNDSDLLAFKKYFDSWAKKMNH